MNPLPILFSLFGPFLVWPVEYLLPYPFIIEELFKGFVVAFFASVSKSPRESFLIFLSSGVLFALTETVLYSININLFGDFSFFFIRLVTSAALHSATFLIIAFSFLKDKRLIIGAVTLTILMHYLYNRYIPSY